MPMDPHPTPRKKRRRKAKNIQRGNIENLDKRLEVYPNLREKLVEVLDAADNKGGVEEADAAEELIVGLMRDLGNLTLQTWADNQTVHKAEEFEETHPEAENKEKKN